MDNLDDINFLSDANCELVKYKENPIKDICLLTKNFDLSSIPSNYMRRRSKIEEIIYRAIFSQNNHKSPFSSFKIANNCLLDLDKIDIVTGINNLKKVVKSLYSNHEQISIMVHKIGGTWLLDEFDLDALFMRHHQYADWDWLRNFIRQECFQLSKPDLSRASLSMRDLYAKFLYHSVSQPSIEMSNSEQDLSSNQVTTYNLQPVQSFKMDSPTKYGGSSRRFDSKNEDFLNLVDWKLEDLSFVVGSDLSIFGTKRHPCISLRLSPYHERINVLTGIDMWLENMLNEVPEIAMCYHDRGIVMSEYEILNTSEIPKLVDFNEQEIKSIAKNLSHFLSTNATKEGHTYWLFKEADSTTVKLYDLTSIWQKEQYEMNEIKQNSNSNSKISFDSNPFVIPVAVLCYRMAENRVNQWYRARERCGKTKLTSSQYNKELLDNKLADNEFYFIEIFRLLKNCINLLNKTDKHKELVSKAMLMMCRLYLEVDQTTLNNFQSQQDYETRTGFTKFELSDLKHNIDFSGLSGSENCLVSEDLSLIGSQLFDYCAKKNTHEILEQAIKLIDIGHNRQEDLLIDQEMLFSSISDKLHDSMSSSNNEVKPSLVPVGGKWLCETPQKDKQECKIDNDRQPVNTSLTESVVMYYLSQCTSVDVENTELNQLINIIRCCFMVITLDNQLLSDEVKLLRDMDFYCLLLNSFVTWHVHKDQGSWNNTSVGKNQDFLSPIDRQVLNFHYNGDREKIVKASLLFKAIILPEKKRMEINIQNKIHNSWYWTLSYLISLADKLSNLSISKEQLVLVVRGIPILLNFLVASVVTLYQQKSIQNDVNPEDHDMVEWCKTTVISCIDWIDKWTRLEAYDANLDNNLIVLVWLNKAKMYRLSAAILSEENYNYMAIDSYGTAIDILTKTIKKKPSELLITIKGDRIELMMQMLENAYTSENVGDQNSDLILKMVRAVECADKLHRLESSLQHIPLIYWKLIGLRLRMNFVRYFLNLNGNRSRDYDHILSNFKNDLALIIKKENTLIRCKESLLIEFYMIKIQTDRCEILSLDSMKKFLQENILTLIKDILLDQYASYFETDGKLLVVTLIKHVVVMLQTFLCKCKADVNRKKKRQIEWNKIDNLGLLLQKFSDVIDSNVSLKSVKNLLTETVQNL